jgi:hypothetical protein
MDNKKNYFPSYLSDFGLESGAGVVVEYSNKSKLSTG